MTDFAAPIHRRLRPRAPEPPRAHARERDNWRLILVIFAFILFYAVLGGRMALMALSEPAEPTLGATAQAEPVRGAITDRAGRLLAANLPAYSLYAHPADMHDAEGSAHALAEIFPDMAEEELLALLTDRRSFVWVRRPVTPRQKDRVLDIGEPGLLFGHRDLRFYPAGRTAAHIVGGVKAGREAVQHAELVGAGGAERHFDARLRDPARSGEPLALSLDLSAQAALSDVLAAEKTRLGAKGAAGVLMKAKTGEVVAMVSLPDFDPNERPKKKDRAGGRSPRFNRAVQGVYELGSVFKPITAAMALDAGVANPDSLIATGEPIVWRRNRVRDMHRMPAQMTVTDIIRRSSNVGSARLALMVTTPRFKAYLDALGMFEASPLEIAEARGSRPLLPPKWTELSTMNIAFGHGLAVSPMHLAAAYATLANGGRRVVPTLRQGYVPEGAGEQVFSPRAARQVLAMLRAVVSDGTGRRAEVKGYEIGGKTGTADKPREDGRGYARDRVLATFAAVFPVSDPEYVLIVSMDEPTDRSGRYPSRQASRTAAPAVREAVRRIAPILGLRPRPDLVPIGLDAPEQTTPPGLPVAALSSRQRGDGTSVVVGEAAASSTTTEAGDAAAPPMPPRRPGGRP
ncbi:MAG: penicillin-binding protein 2 [Pseudomonadota bacterium]